MNRQGWGTSRGAQRPNLLSGGARPTGVDPRRLNHTSSGRLGAGCETRQDGLLQDQHLKPDLESATNVYSRLDTGPGAHDRNIASRSLPARTGRGRFSSNRSGESVDNNFGRRSFSHNNDKEFFENEFRKESYRDEYGRGSFGNSHKERSTASVDSGGSFGSAAGFACGRDAGDRGYSMKAKNLWDSGRSSGRTGISMQDSGYSTSSMRSLSNSTGRDDAAIRDMTDDFDDINIGSDDEYSSGWWHVTPDKSSAETATSLPRFTPNPLEIKLKREAPHVLAKRLIYKKYLQGYIPSMMSIPGKQIKVIDGFAGTGRATKLDWPKEIEHYETPIIALRVALHYFRAKDNLKGDVVFDNNRQLDVSEYLSGIEDLRMFAGDRFEIAPSDKHRIVLVFFENEKNMYKELVKNVIKLITMYRVRVDEDKHFKDGFCKIRCDFKGTKRANSEYLVACYIVHADLTKVIPALASDLVMLSSQGDKVVPIDVVKRMADSYKQIFITLESKIGVVNTNRGQAANRMGSNGRKIELDAYEQSLKQNAKADYFLSLETQGFTSTVTGHLIFKTSHIKGFQKMKDAMTKVGESLQNDLICCFTNYKNFKEPYQLHLSPKESEADKATANAVFARFRGNETVLSEVERYVWLETPYVFRKTPLKILEDVGKLTVKNDDQKRTKGKFPDRRDWNFVFSQ